METVKAVIVKRKDGAYMNLHFEPVKSIRAAARFHDKKEYEQFMTGFYAPSNPDNYYPQEIEVTYKEVSENEREHESV